MFHGNVHRHLLALSLANWAIAIICWMISAYLGAAQPTGIIVYAVLFVIGIFAVVVAVTCFVLADFGTEPHALVTAEGPSADRADAPTGEAADPAPAPTGKPAAGA